MNRDSKLLATGTPDQQTPPGTSQLVGRGCMHESLWWGERRQVRSEGVHVREWSLYLGSELTRMLPKRGNGSENQSCDQAFLRHYFYLIFLFECQDLLEG